MDQWYRLPLGHSAVEYQTLRKVRQLRLQHDEGTGPASVLPLLLDRVSVSLWLYLPPGNGGLAERLNALPCPAPDYEQEQLVKLSEEYHPARPPLRVPVLIDSVPLVSSLNLPTVGPGYVG